MGTQPMEILAPVGGEEQLHAAVKAGADAVYLGAKGFNARQNAQNFLHLGDAVEFCHKNGVRVYVTLNTLVRDDEWDSFGATVTEVAASGADGVIVQDLGVADYVQKRFPTLPLHASTQMTIHNLSGAKLLESMGFRRVVLARELTLEEIKLIAKNTTLEIEAFVHGALCMSVSGACYFSGMLGERSGNRGSCAQTCRLPMGIGGRDYALSLKDMSHVRHMQDMAAAGVTSFKIEGRMKSPSYVYAAVKACGDALAGKMPDLDGLQRQFSRSGFTDGYLLGKRDLQMFGRRTKADVEATQQSGGVPAETAPKKPPIPTAPHIEAPGFQWRTIPKSHKRKKKPQIWVQFRSPQQMPSDLQAHTVILPVWELQDALDLLDAADFRLMGEIPPLVFPFREKELTTLLTKLYSKGLRHVLCHNLGAVELAQKLGFTVHGGYGLNMLNSYALAKGKEIGLADATVSFELFLRKIQALDSPIPIGMIGYGYLPLMQLRSCPVQTNKGCKGCKGRGVITDRKNLRFPLLCNGRQFTTLLNSVPVYMGDKDLSGIDHCILSFTTEPAHMCSKIISMFAAASPPDFPRTRGAYERKLL